MEDRFDVIQMITNMSSLATVVFWNRFYRIARGDKAEAVEWGNKMRPVFDGYYEGILRRKSEVDTDGE